MRKKKLEEHMKTEHQKTNFDAENFQEYFFKKHDPLWPNISDQKIPSKQN